MSANSGLTVLVIGRFYAEAFGLLIANAFESMGHRVVRFEAGVTLPANAGRWRTRYDQVRSRIHEVAGSLGFFRQAFRRKMLRAATTTPVDLTLVCHDFLTPQEISLLRQVTRSPVALWFPDHIAGFTRTYFLDAEYDALFFKDPYIVHTLRRTLGKRIYYLPEAYDPDSYREEELSEEDQKVYGCDLATAGNLYAYRAAFFAQLADYEVKIWGNPPPPWMDDRRIRPMVQGRYVVSQDKFRAFRAAKIVLNNLYPAEIWGINCRAFEIAGIGGFQLVDWRPGLGQLFEDGSELVSFETMDDLRKKIDYYLAHPDERLEIARRGQERARRDHTLRHRLTCLVDTVGGSAEGFPVPDIQVTRTG